MDVKVCSLRSSSFDSDFDESVRNTGFAVLTDHGIDHDLIKECQQAWRMFFLDNQAYKEGFVNTTDGNVGYKGMRSEKAVGAKVADLKEFYHWQPGKKIPNEVSGVTSAMFDNLSNISQILLGILDERYTGPKFGFKRCCAKSDNTILRTLYYPAMDFGKEPDAIRAAAHEDINFITLLVAASAPGLQVKDLAGNWHDVPHEENSIAVNIGDMLQMATNGYYKSTTHRVVNPDNSRADRVSMPLFVHPHSDTVLSENFTAKKYLDQRIAEIYQQVKS